VVIGGGVVHEDVDQAARERAVRDGVRAVVGGKVTDRDVGLPPGDADAVATAVARSVSRPCPRRTAR
jgi:hypothetical protein